MKIMTIDFIRHNAWGSTDWATHYYVDGKRVSGKRIGSYEFYAHKNYRWDHTDEFTKEKDGITRNYKVMWFVEKDH